MMVEIIREKIDHIDQQIVRLLEKRMELVNQVVAYKKETGKAILDSNRENEVLEKIAVQIQHKEFEKTIVQTFADIMKNSRDYQTEQLK